MRSVWDHEVIFKFNQKFVPYLNMVEQWEPKGISEAAFRAIYPGGENWQVGDSPVVDPMRMRSASMIRSTCA